MISMSDTACMGSIATNLSQSNVCIYWHCYLVGQVKGKAATAANQEIWLPGSHGMYATCSLESFAKKKFKNPENLPVCLISYWAFIFFSSIHYIWSSVCEYNKECMHIWFFYWSYRMSSWTNLNQMMTSYQENCSCLG